MNRVRWSLAAGLLLAASAAASAQEVPRIAFEKYTLPNGLEVILHEDRSVPLVVVHTYYKVGAFDQMLEAAGAANNGSTNTDRTDYYEQMPSNALPLALWLDADRMGYLLPTMDLAKLDVQRDVVKNERRQRVDNVPYGRAFEIIDEALYPASHPYSWPVIGSMEDLSAATLEDVKEFFRTYYAPNNATMVISGSFDADSAKAWVSRYFGDIPRGPAMPARPAPAPVTLAADTFLVLEDRVQLPRLYEAWHSVPLFSPDDAALDVLAYVLAGGKNARLYKRLVYEMQVAQDVSAFQNSGKLAGSFWIMITPKPEQAPARMAELLQEEVDAVIARGVTPEEMARAKNSIRAQFLDRLASVLGKANQLNLYNYFAGTPDYVRQDAARYEAVTAADVQRVANTYLRRHRVVLTVVPEGKADLKVSAGGQ